VGAVSPCKTRYARIVYDRSGFHVWECVFDSQECPAKINGYNLVKFLDGKFCDWRVWTGKSRIVHQTIEAAEMFHRKLHERFRVGGTRGVAGEKRRAWADFFCECFAFVL
jgi:hypothetical protein